MICSHSDRMPSKPAACLPAAAMILTAFAWHRTASASSPATSLMMAPRSSTEWRTLSKVACPSRSLDFADAVDAHLDKLDAPRPAGRHQEQEPLPCEVLQSFRLGMPRMADDTPRPAPISEGQGDGDESEVGARCDVDRDDTNGRWRRTDANGGKCCLSLLGVEANRCQWRQVLAETKP